MCKGQFYNDWTELDEWRDTSQAKNTLRATPSARQRCDDDDAETDGRSSEFNKSTHTGKHRTRRGNVVVGRRNEDVDKVTVSGFKLTRSMFHHSALARYMKHCWRIYPHDANTGWPFFSLFNV